MRGRRKHKPMEQSNRRVNNSSVDSIRRELKSVLRPGSSSNYANGIGLDAIYDDDTLAPVMPAIDAVQFLMEEESRTKLAQKRLARRKRQHDKVDISSQVIVDNQLDMNPDSSVTTPKLTSSFHQNREQDDHVKYDEPSSSSSSRDTYKKSSCETVVVADEEKPPSIINNLPSESTSHFLLGKQEEYEFIPKSAILDVYSNDPEVKRFLKQLPKIGAEFGFNEQDYKCYSCRRPIGLVFGSSRLCHFDGHHYCFECHLGEKTCIPGRILCNWDFCKYPISKRNQHFLSLIATEPIFELKTVAPLLYKHCPELREIEELRCQAFFIRSYCFTCVQESISFELTKLVWPREHLIKQIDSYSLDDLIQIKSGVLKNVLKNVITFGRQHVLSCMLCCQKGFICEICKSSQIIYPFDTESVHRCNGCQSIFHKTCFKSKTSCDPCPRCQRLKARRKESRGL